MRGPKFRGSSNLSVLIIIMLVTIYVVHYLTNIISAESEKDSTTFKVTVSIIGVTKETGDITAIVTVDGLSKVKTFKSDPGRLSANSSINWYELKFVATFPDVVLDPGTVYRACVIKLNDMHHYCQEGKYSSAKSQEFVSIVLDKKIKRPEVEKYKAINIVNYLPRNETNEELRDVLPNYSH
jgi:hypothetical protein